MRSQRLAPREARALALSCHVLLAGRGYPWPDRGRLRRRRTGREIPGWERRARVRPWRRGTPLGGWRVTADICHRRVERERVRCVVVRRGFGWQIVPQVL